MSSDPVTLGGELTMYAARLVRSVRASIDTPAGARVLSILDQRGPASVTALAAEYGCSQPSMSGLVADLISREWVDKRPDPSDARASLVELTATGAAALADVRRQHGELVARRVAAHSDRTVADLATAVAVLRDVLDEIPKEEP